MRARVIPVTGVLLVVGALFAPASAFGFASPACLGPRQASARSGVTSLQATVGRALDPMSLIYNKDMQQCPLRPYKSPEDNNGLATATFALG
jgi:hypothetical protein